MIENLIIKTNIYTMFCSRVIKSVATSKLIVDGNQKKLFG